MGILTAAAMFLTRVVLAAAAGGNAASGLAMAGALLIMLAIGAAAVCVPVALRRKFQVRKRARAESSGP